MLKITEEDIKYVEELFLPKGATFDDQRRAVIKATTSLDVLACAGSGKTTVLASKLAILANKLPLPDGRGICVLTHTNVAINEVKNKLGARGNILFSYPNFFGTFQTFVDKFLASPSYTLLYGKRPVRIDTEVFEEVILRNQNKLSHGARYWLSQNSQGQPLSLLKNLRFSASNMNYIVKDNIGNAPIIANPNSPTNKELLAFKKSILEAGILCYDDAYSLAFHYIRNYKDKLRQAISERFGYVFIDEMQDTDFHQLQLLDEIIAPNVILQRVGDINQSIFNIVKDSNFWNPQNGYLTICGSKRFSNSIAQKIDTLSIKQMGIQGNCDMPDIPPKVLIYNDATINRVLPSFAEIIQRNGLHETCKNKTFKAIGWVGKAHETGHRTIGSYWSGYEGSKKSKKTEHDNMQGYLRQAIPERVMAEGANYYRKSILRLLLRVLRKTEKKDISTGRYYSEVSLLSYLQDKKPTCYDKLLSKIVEWCIKIQSQCDVSQDVRNFICNDFKEAFGFEVASINDFLNDTRMEQLFGVPEASDNGINGSDTFKYTEDISVELSTVHSVKGETHTATLYLETFYRGYDMPRIFDYLCGQYSTPSGLSVSTLKMAYVGMTRPTHLLCVAMHRDSLNNREKRLETVGWECIPVY